MVVDAYFDTGKFDQSYFDNVTQFGLKLTTDMGEILNDDISDTFTLG